MFDIPAARAMASAAPMAVDFFLRIDGIEGESTDAKHKGEWRVRPTGTSPTRG